MKLFQDIIRPCVRRRNDGRNDKNPCVDDSASSTTGTWEHDRHSVTSTMQAARSAAGRAMLARMERFESSSSLCLEEDRPHKIAKLSWNDVTIGRLLGSGGFSSVYTCTVSVRTEEKESHHETCDEDIISSNNLQSLMYHKDFAVKFLDKKIWERGAESVSLAAADLAFEAKILSCLNHKNIIELHGASGGSVLTSFEESQHGFFLVQELLGETLSNRLQRWKVNGHKDVLSRLTTAAVGISQGMEYLHRKNIVFRDLKPENIGFCKFTGNVKIFDFGLATEIDMGERLNATVGTPRYMAPEIMMGDTYGMSCDVYSFGLVLWQICSLKKPFPKQSRKRGGLFAHVAVQNCRPHVGWLKCPASTKDLMRECWHQDPKRRPRFSTICTRLEAAILASK